MSDITNIELVFENLEYMHVPAECFECIEITDIKDSISRIAFNSIAKQSIAYSTAFKLSKNFNKIEFSPFCKEDYETAIDRLITHSDIASITLKYSNGKKEEIYPIWCEESDTCNSYQNSYLSPKGELYISIHKEKSVFDMFEELKELNPDKDTTREIHSMFCANCSECDCVNYDNGSNNDSKSATNEEQDEQINFAKKEFKINPAMISINLEADRDTSDLNDIIADNIQEMLLSGWEEKENAIFY